MNIAFVYTINPHDINQWSGILYYIYHTLSKNHNVILMGGGMILFQIYILNMFIIKEVENFILKTI